MNEVLDSIHRLRSVREFSEQPVSDRDLQTIYRLAYVHVMHLLVKAIPLL